MAPVTQQQQDVKTRYFWEDEALLSIEEKRTVFENVLMRGRTDAAVNAVWNLHNIAHRYEPQLATLNAVLLASAKAGEELGYFGCLYKITNVLSGERYIGQTKRPFYSRIKDHLESAANYDSSSKFHPLYAAIQELGLENFAVQVVDVVWTENAMDLNEGLEVAKDALNEREKAHIERENSYYLKGYGYNRTSGGAGTTDVDEETRIVRDLRMAINKYGVFAVMRQAYVFWLAEAGLSHKEIAERAGYSSTRKVTNILDENAKERRGQSVKAALPYLNQILESHVFIAEHFNKPIEDTLNRWADRVVGSKRIFTELNTAAPYEVRPTTVEAVGKLLAEFDTKGVKQPTAASAAPPAVPTKDKSPDVKTPARRKRSGLER